MSAQHDRRPAAPRGRVAAPRDRDAEASTAAFPSAVHARKRPPAHVDTALNPAVGGAPAAAVSAVMRKTRLANQRPAPSSNLANESRTRTPPPGLLERLCQRGETEHKQYGCGGHKEVEGLPPPLLPSDQRQLFVQRRPRRGTGRERRPRATKARTTREAATRRARTASFS
jgi:hypothetical protein